MTRTRTLGGPLGVAMCRAALAVAIATTLGVMESSLAASADQKDPLTRARQLYNLHQYDAAIAAAREAGRTAATADEARVVLARALLERFRQDANAADLDDARTALVAVHAGSLTPRDRLALTIALGESLYFDDRFGAAAEIFDGALGQTGPEAVTPRERVLDWWANAVDRQAQIDPDAVRQAAYERLLQRMDEESHAHPESLVAAYWIVAAARGAEDLDRAWHAAIAAWVRAPFIASPEAAQSLRADLDRLMTDGVIPDRARLLGPRMDTRQLITTLTAEWTAVKDEWK